MIVLFFLYFGNYSYIWHNQNVNQMKKALFTILTAILLSLTANAQPYKNAVGISFGPNWTGPDHNLGVQWNHFLSEKTNLDVRALYNFNWGPIFEGLYEWDVYIGEGGFRFYGGPGVHFGFVPNYNGKGDACAAFGFTGAAGFEYVFSKVPLAISIDWRPYLTWQPKLDNKAKFGYSGIDFGFKYCF